jgi:TRAP-type C4-dicarboxylate transport system permease small subunit
MSHSSAVGDNPRLRLLAAVRQVLGLACAALLLAMMLVTVIDVIGRYFFGRPLAGSSELTELLLAATIFMGLPAVCLEDGHVTVDLVTERLPAWTRGWRVLAMRVICAVVLAVIGWRLIVHGMRLASYQEVTIYLRLPVAPVAYAMGGLAWLAALLVALLVVLRVPEGRLSDPVETGADAPASGGAR